MNRFFSLFFFVSVITCYFACSNDAEFPVANGNTEFSCQAIDNETIMLPNGMKVVKKDSFYVFQGDIYFTEEDIVEMSRTSRGSFTTDKTKWEPRIPYVVSSGFLKGTELATALEHWEEATNIKFVPRTTENKYIVFHNSSDGTNHTAGYGKPTYTTNTRNIYIASNAVTGNIIHEIGHALGLTHEQCRSDRNNYIRILSNNIISSKRDQYDIYDNTFCSHYSVPFDFNSIMMYPSYSSNAINPNLPVMEDINDPTNTNFGGQRSRLSEEDRALFNNYLYRNEQYYISGNDRVQVPQRYTYNVRVPANSRVSWSITPNSNVSIVSGQNTNSVTLQFYASPGGTEYTLHANITTPHNYTWNKHFNITACSGPVIQDILMYKYCQSDGEYTLEAEVSDANSSITWNTDGTLYDILYPDDILFSENPHLFKAVDFYNPGTHIVEATATNATGSNTYSKSFTINDSKSQMMSLAPNPSSTGIFTIEINNISENRTPYISQANAHLYIYSQGKIIYSCEMDALKKKVELPKLADGKYLVEYDDPNKGKIRQILIVKR